MIEKEATTIIQGPVSRWSIFDRAVNGTMINLMETLDGWGYIATGFSFLLVGMVVFVHSWYVFAMAVGSKAVPAVLELVHDLLLVLGQWHLIGGFWSSLPRLAAGVLKSRLRLTVRVRGGHV